MAACAVGKGVGGKSAGTSVRKSRLDEAFVKFAKAYFRDKNTERETGAKWELPALKCLEAALLTVTGSGSVQGMSLAVLDEADIVARNHYSAQAGYHVGRNIAEIARFVSTRRLVRVDVSTWKSTLTRPSSVRRTGDAGQSEIASKMPSQAGLDAMAEIFANDPDDPIARFISAVWGLLMAAPWRISEVLRLHVDAEHEEKDDRGVISYGLRYYGSKGFEYDVKWISRRPWNRWRGKPVVGSGRQPSRREDSRNTLRLTPRPRSCMRMHRRPAWTTSCRLRRRQRTCGGRCRRDEDTESP